MKRMKTNRLNIYEILFVYILHLIILIKTILRNTPRYIFIKHKVHGKRIRLFIYLLSSELD